MNRNFIFVFILLATIFMVNAVPQKLSRRSTITFNACPLKDTPTLTVTIVPNPVVAGQGVSFSVFGTLNDDVTAGRTKLAIGFADSSGQNILEPNYYQVFTQSVKAGDQVTIVAPNVPTPAQLPADYTIGVAIGDPNEGDPFEPLDVYGCADAVVGGNNLSFSFKDTGISE